VDGRGNIFPTPLLRSPSDLGIDEIASLRVVEIRKLAPDFRVKGGLVIVYGTCSGIPHRRYICADIYELRQDLMDTSKGPLLPVTLLGEEVTSSSFPFSLSSSMTGVEELSLFSPDWRYGIRAILNSKCDLYHGVPSP
jgi:hypothetical protein